jgi:hypothetical protein
LEPEVKRFFARELSMKKLKVDADALKNIPAKAAECGVPERWLRNRIAAGEVSCVRIGWNVFIPDTETNKIKDLAASRDAK